MNAFTRRRFVAATVTAAIAPTLTSRGDEDTDGGWIDAHVHVWPKDREKYPISPKFKKAAVKPPEFSPETLRAQQKGTGVERTVLIQMSFYGFDNSYMLDVIESDPDRYRGVALVDASEPEPARRMADLAEGGVGGFRLSGSPEKVKEWESSPGINEMWKAGAEQGLAMCCLVNPEALPAVHRMCRKYPETPVVIDHFARVGVGGEIDQEQLDGLLGLARFDKVHVKTSAFYALGEKRPPYTDLAPMFRQVRDAFGSERLMWGSDCPYQVQGEHTYEASVALVRDRLAFLSEEEKTDILRNTAEKVFFG
ncbi:MAG: amidohydrolase family protein [Verrucomicrobiales bacterium]